MKKIILFTLLICAQGFSQKLIFDESTEIYKLDTIVNSGNNKDALYSNALSFFSTNFNDSRNVIESKDAESGEILFKGNSATIIRQEYKKRKKTHHYYETVTLYFKGKVIVKDNRYRLIFSNPKYTYLEGVDMAFNLYPSSVNSEKKQESEAFKMLVDLQDSFIRYMERNSDSDF